MFDPNHFSIVCGQETLDDYRDKISLAVNGWGHALPTAQERLWAENGFRDAQLVESIHGWSVRFGSGLDGWGFIAGRGMNWTFARAAEAAKAWQAEDPFKRFVSIRKTDLPQAQA